MSLHLNALDLVGARYAIVEDPDGNYVGVMSPSDPARRATRYLTRA